MPVASTTAASPPLRAFRAAFWFAAAGYLIAGVAASLYLSIDVPFADAWRHYARLLTEPVFTGVFAADNGHLEIVANAVRWIALRWFDGSERFQTVIGLGFALCASTLLALVMWRDDRLSATARAAAMLAMTLGLFWLGNARALLHNSDALHVYSVMALLALALRQLVGEDVAPSLAPVWRACLCCVAATFCFGSGIAAFAAVAVLLILQRASIKAFALWFALALCSLVAYRMMTGGSEGIAFRPWDQLMVMLRMLAQPIQFLFWPLVDTDAASAMPSPVRGFFVACANGWTSVFGDARVSRQPFALIGAGFIAVFAAVLHGARRDATTTQRLGLALAAFGIAIALLVGVTRVGYFDANPDQISSPRYMPWPSLAWAGLLLTFVARRNAGRATWITVAGIAVLALFAEIGNTIVMRHQADDATQTLLGALVGIDVANEGPSENLAIDVSRGADAMRAASLGAFARAPRVHVGEPVPAFAHRVPMRWREPAARRGTLVVLRGDEAASSCSAYRLIAQGERIVGIAKYMGRDSWMGISRMTNADAALDAYDVCR